MSKRKVTKRMPAAYCCKLSEPIFDNRYIVWPGKVGQRGTITAAIGVGRTARAAWASVAVRAAGGAKG